MYYFNFKKNDFILVSNNLINWELKQFVSYSNGHPICTSLEDKTHGDVYKYGLPEYFFNVYSEQEQQLYLSYLKSFPRIKEKFKVEQILETIKHLKNS